MNLWSINCRRVVPYERLLLLLLKDTNQQAMKRQRVTLELRDEVIDRAQEVAQQFRMTLETVLEEWLNRYADDLPMEALPDDEVLVLCNYELNILQQQELTLLLHHHRERALNSDEQVRLDELLQLHRRGLVRKARAIQVAMARGLLPPYTS